LVRDKIPEIIEKDGEKPIIHIAGDDEYEEALKNKLHEETTEFLENISLKEAGDMMEVMRAILALRGIDASKLEEERQKRLEERGGFEKRIILERTEK